MAEENTEAVVETKPEAEIERIEEPEPSVSKRIGSIQFSVFSPKMIKKMAANILESLTPAIEQFLKDQ